MHERIKEYDRDIRLSRTQTLAVSEHANNTEHYSGTKLSLLTETLIGTLFAQHWAR